MKSLLKRRMNKQKIRWSHHPRAIYSRLKEVFIACQNDIHIRDYRATHYRPVHHVTHQPLFFHRDFGSIDYLD